MTREVTIGEQVIKLRATARLPIAYRALHNRDLLRDMDAWREKLKVMLEERENAQVSADTAEVHVGVLETSADVAEVSVGALEVPTDAPEASGQTEADSADASPDNSEILYTMDLDLVARLAYAMAKSAEPSIPDNMQEWLDALESPNALYILTGEVLTLYNNGFETTAQAKKNIPPQRGK